MAEYIEVSQLWQCETCFYHRSGRCTLGMFGCDHGESYRPAYDKLKKVDLEPVKHGRWIKHEGYDECNLCHTKTIYGSNYCPNCGAKMGEEEPCLT